jgi:hypothetical protein
MAARMVLPKYSSGNIKSTSRGRDQRAAYRATRSFETGLGRGTTAGRGAARGHSALAENAALKDRAAREWIRKVNA